MRTHERLYEAAEKAADALHRDTSVSLDETWHSLAGLRDHIELLMDGVANSMPNEEEGIE